MPALAISGSKAGGRGPGSQPCGSLLTTGGDPPCRPSTRGPEHCPQRNRTAIYWWHAGRLAGIPVTMPGPIGLDPLHAGSESGMRHTEQHRTTRIGWLRASVLGANDGIVSTASLVIGVAATHASWNEVLVAGVAGLTAGALSMAAGEYVSVSSQADTERADVARETRELKEDPEGELRELTGIYVSRGLDADLARTVALQLTAKDALTAHARDELGISEALAARPLQAALSSAAAFAIGAVLPIFAVVVSPQGYTSGVVAAASLAFLAALGALAARTGGAPPLVGAARVAFWGAIAMLVTAVVGRIFGAVV
jgi:VIT1/CCC1 family predicted Fe2+/Mn2+ transporter